MALHSTCCCDHSSGSDHSDETPLCQLEDEAAWALHVQGELYGTGCKMIADVGVMSIFLININDIDRSVNSET